MRKEEEEEEEADGGDKRGGDVAVDSRGDDALKINSGDEFRDRRWYCIGADVVLHLRSEGEAALM